MLKAILAALALSLVALSPARGESPAPLPPPQGEALLTVTGRIGVRNMGDAAVFDRDMLSALPLRGIVTGTVWTEGVSRFRGVPLSAVLDRVGAPRVGTLRLTALNDYAVETPIEGLLRHAPLLAMERDGRIMNVRDKGPIWLLFPYDQDEKWRTERNLTLSIWQLIRIEVLE